MRMNVAISLNHKYVKYASVMLTSLFENNADCDICVYAMEADLSEDDKRFLQDLSIKYKQMLTTIHINKDDYASELPVTSEWSLETYFRLQMMDVLPVEVDRILYIDIDVIVNKQILSFYEMDFEGQLFIACPDAVRRPPFGDVRDELFRDIQDQMCYFNAGVLLWNIEALRREGYNFHYYMELARKLDYKILAPDQDLLNLAHWNRVIYVDETQYDFYARIGHSVGVTYDEVKEAVSIIHYVGYKPWSGEFWHYDIEKLWWEYAKKTSCYMELLEEFLESSLSSTTLEVTINTAMQQKKELIEGMQRATALIERLTKA